MHWKIPLATLLLLVAICSCSENAQPVTSQDIDPQADANYQVAFVRDSSIYLYDQATDTTIALTQLFANAMSNTLESIDDHTVMVGYSGKVLDSAFNAETGKPMLPRDPDYDEYILAGVTGSDRWHQFEYYTVTYLATDTRTKATWWHKKVEFRHKGHPDQKLYIHTTFFDRAGAITHTSDSITDCWGKSTIDWVNYCDPEDRFASTTQEVNGKKVRAVEGNLFLLEGDKIELLLPNEAPYWDMKLGNGYCSPNMSPDGKRFVYRKFSDDMYYNGRYIDRADSGIYEMELQTRAIRHWIPENAFGPIYSPQGRYILCGRVLDQRNGEGFSFEVVVVDRTTGSYRSLGEGEGYTWMKRSPQER